ncbi:MAG: TRAP transporter small permease [Rhodobiaceae bacterium]|nr:TRAP transporter small permease [Rhodobiaceae bacterium]MCC0055340.1 TRAP transporter small permease [Rhodobiaceae bacterium]
MAALNTATTAINRFVHFSHLLAGMVVLPVMIFLIGLDVTMRYAFSAPLVWVQELTSLLLIIVIMLGLGYAYAQRVHVRMEMLYERGGSGFQALGDVLAALCGLLLFSMLAWQAWLDIPYMLRIGEATEELGIILWPFRLFLCFMCIVVCIQLLLDMVKALRMLFAPSADEPRQ